MVVRFYPPPQDELPLEGLYLQHALHREQARRRPRVYTNFIASLDGRIAIEHPRSGRHYVPGSIANPRDWRLFQELAAQSDVLVVSARYLRQLSEGAAQDTLPLSDDSAYADLHAWRREQGLAPQPAVVVLSASLDLPLEVLGAQQRDRSVYVATGDDADRDALAKIEHSGIEVLYTGEGKKVNGKRLIETLVQLGFRSIYSIAGPGVLETLLAVRVLDRLYLTQVHRLIGGASYDSLLEGGYLSPPADFDLRALHYDRMDRSRSDFGQFYGVYDVVPVDQQSHKE
jgi:riboflavin biosynthesis pyrimidine reductase